MDLQTALNRYCDGFDTQRDEKVEGIGADCPHCGVHATFSQFNETPLLGQISLKAPARKLIQAKCPNRECLKVVVVSSEYIDVPDAPRQLLMTLLWPSPRRTPRDPAGLSESARTDYREACSVLHVSPNASAVLARRCLQTVLRERLEVKPGKLVLEIQEALKGDELNKTTKTSLDHIREVGNWGAHPDKDPAVTLIDVSPEEAEYLLDALDLVFNDLYTNPAKVEAMGSRIAAKAAAFKGATPRT